MQRVYDGEIDVAIDWCWDGGFRIRLGNELSGFEAQARHGAIVEDWLRKEIVSTAAAEQIYEAGSASARAKAGNGWNPTSSPL